MTNYVNHSMHWKRMKPLPLLDFHGVWHITYFVGLAWIIPVLVFRFSIPFSLKLLWSWLLIWCLFLLEWPSAHFGVYTSNFQATAGQVFVEAFLIPLIAINFYKAIEKLIPFLAMFLVACVWFNWPGLMHAPSFSMALAAACIPAIPLTKKWIWFSFFIVFTALTHHGSTALVIIGAQLFAFVSKNRIKKHWLLLGIIIAVASAFFFQPSHNSGTERLHNWVEYFTFWAKDWKHIIFGMGPGSFVWYSVLTYPYQTGMYLQIHNDYLEVLWALGLVGFTFLVGAVYEVVKRAWNQNILSLAGILGSMAFMLTYEPLEYFPSALLIAFYLARVLIVENIHVKFTSFTRTY